MSSFTTIVQFLLFCICNIHLSYSFCISKSVLVNENGITWTKSNLPPNSQYPYGSEKTIVRSTSTSTRGQYDSIEPYVGPISSISNMEGGIAISELALQVLVGPSLVADGFGLFLSLFDDDDNGNDNDEYKEDGDQNNVDHDYVEEVIIPQGTPLCGYARGYFSDEEAGDKSVGFLFQDSNVAVFYQKQLMTISEAIHLAHYNNDNDNDNDETKDEDVKQLDEKNILWGHIVKNIDMNLNEEKSKDEMKITLLPDQEFASRIFLPEIDDENQFGATCLGIYANDLAYDPTSFDNEAYLKQSDSNNILQLIWRLDKDEKTGMLVPTWPVVAAKKDIRLVNTVPMEIGLQYGFQYWDSYQKSMKSH